VHGNFFLAISPHQHRHIPQLCLGNVCDVHRKRIHRDTTNHRRAFAVDERRALIPHARKTIAVADGQHGDPTWFTGGVSHSVADGVAGVQLLDCGDAGFNTHYCFDARDAPANR
jgi:hypothetical protein